MNVHLKLRPYSCRYGCEFGKFVFSKRKNNLLKLKHMFFSHFALHYELQFFSCLAYNNLSNRNSHEKKKHGGLYSSAQNQNEVKEDHSEL